MRMDYRNWLFLLRSISIIFQVGLLLGMCYLLQWINELEFFSSSSSLIFKMPMAYSFLSVIITYTTSQISYFLTKFELWDTYGKSFHLRIWKSFAIQILGIYYTCLIKIPLEGSNLSYIGLSNNFKFLYSDFNCSIEQASYSLLSLYFSQFLWNLIAQILPNFFNLFQRKKSSDLKSKILKNSTPFRVLEETCPIIILNMIGNMIVPVFPLITLINIFLHALIFLYNWKVAIKWRFQYYSSISRQFIMRTLVKFYFIANLLSLIYFAILSYQDQASYFVGGEYTKNNIQRICGPLDVKQTVASTISNDANQIQYLNQLFELISWQPLLWVIIIFLFMLSRLETNTKNVWRNEYFIKSREMQTVKNYFQQQAKNYEKKIKLAQQELSNLDTPMNAQKTVFFSDFSHANNIKSKFSMFENNKNQSPKLFQNGAMGYLGDQAFSPNTTQSIDDTKISLLSRQNFVINQPNANSNIKLNMYNSNSSKFKPF